MAIIKPGSLIADIRGKCGDNVFSRNHAGNIVRSAGTWEQPAEGPIQDARDAIELVSQAWSSALTDAQRDTWRQYGRLYPGCNRWGESRPTTGFNAFVRHNLIPARRDADYPFHDAPAGAPLVRPQLAMTCEALGAIGVTGACTPDVTGVYSLYGTYQSHPVWDRADSAYKLWFSTTRDRWEIGTVPGSLGTVKFYKPSTCSGTWTPKSPSTGNPVSVKDDEHSAVNFALPPTNEPAPLDGYYLFFYLGVPCSPGRAYYSGPWLFVGESDYEPPWSLSPARFVTPSLITAGQRLWSRCIAQNFLTGEMSSPGISRCTESAFDE